MPGPDSKPAELPLPGGRDGATVRLHPLLSATAAWPEAWPHRAGGRLGPLRALGVGSRTVPIPIVAFLVEHPGAGPFVIDTGMHPSIADDPSSNLGRLTATTLGRTFELKAAVPDLVRERGVDPADVGLVAMTHLHFDHSSGMPQFGDATVLVSGREWSAATGPRPLLKGYVGGHWEGARDVRTLDFDGARAEAVVPFARTLDLFGDGSVRAAFTPGHTHGHVSYVLRTGARDVLVVGDAVYTRHTLATGHRPTLIENGADYGRSLEQIQDYARANPDALVIPGHDMEAWEELDEVYG